MQFIWYKALFSHINLLWDTSINLTLSCFSVSRSSNNWKDETVSPVENRRKYKETKLVKECC